MKDSVSQNIVQHTANNSLEPAKNDILLLMCHHIHCKDYHGMVGSFSHDVYGKLPKNDIINERRVNANQLVEMNTWERL